MIRVVLPQHLRTLAKVNGDVEINLPGDVSLTNVLDALEDRFPQLRGTVRDHTTKKRRAFVRFFACGDDLTHDSPDAPLPAEVIAGKEPLMIIGAIAGG